jgi:NADH-quinone oxidoreductase subunit A
MVVLIASTALWPAVLYAALVVVIAAAIIGLSAVLGQRHREPETTMPYESGIRPAGPPPRRLAVQFYLVALFFVIFDLEAVFVFAWAIGARRLGWAGYIEIVVFIVVLLAGLVYLWKTGSLDWGPSRREPPAQPEEKRS